MATAMIGMRIIPPKRSFAKRSTARWWCQRCRLNPSEGPAIPINTSPFSTASEWTCRIIAEMDKAFAAASARHISFVLGHQKLSHQSRPTKVTESLLGPLDRFALERRTFR
jgi:hypothetical protein